MKLYTDSKTYLLFHQRLVAAELANQKLEVVMVNEETRASKDFKAKNPCNKLPMLE